MDLPSIQWPALNWDCSREGEIRSFGFLAREAMGAWFLPYRARQ